jgi:hypothetical protein
MTCSYLCPVPVATPQPRRSLPVDNIVIYGEATARVRGSAGAGGVCQRRGDRLLRVWGAERGGAVPEWARGAGSGKAAPGLELDAYLQVTAAERLTP